MRPSWRSPKALFEESRAHSRMHPGFVLMLIAIAFLIAPRLWPLLLIGFIIFMVMSLGKPRHHAHRSRKRHGSHLRSHISSPSPSSSRRDDSRLSFNQPSYSPSSAVAETSTTSDSQHLYCPRCGAEVEPTDIFCLNCGYKLLE